MCPYHGKTTRSKGPLEVKEQMSIYLEHRKVKTQLCRDKNRPKGENKFVFVIKQGRTDFIFGNLHDGFLLTFKFLR